jgi:F-type H+-transporting ATPase subunit delta
LRTTFNVDPSLIGGLRITAGTDVYDGSVRARLDAVEQSF